MNIENKIAKKTNINDEIKNVIVGIGPTRSGTTLFLRIFAEFGIHSWYQPFKAILRGFVHDNEVDFTIENADFDTIFIKETLGPYTYNEASLNSIKVLLKAGVDREKIKLITLVREPYSTVASSIVHFSKFKERENIISISLMCYDSIFNINQFAKKNGIETNCFVYETWNKNNPLDILVKLFSKMGMPITKEKLTHWKALESLNENKYIHNLYEPDFYHHTDFSYRIKNSNNISFSSKTENDIKIILTPNEIEIVKKSRAIDIYDHFHHQTELDLKVKINKLNLFV